MRKTVRLARLMEVPIIVCMSGLPAAPGDSSPNWVSSSWPPENVTILEHQWEQVAIPYWRDFAFFAAEQSVQLAIQPCFAQLIYNASTARRLIDSVGSRSIGVNLDPSHLMAMGADIPSVIRALAGSIVHVQAKSDLLNAPIVAANGLHDGTAMTLPQDRAWNYETLGLGHPAGESVGMPDRHARCSFTRNYPYLNAEAQVISGALEGSFCLQISCHPLHRTTK
nr:TIM barrel protein [Paeniglutamicibacter terrestris]